MTSFSVTIRQLDEDDAAIFQPLRLRSLREHPEAFGASFEEESTMSLEQVAQQLRGPSSSFTFGAFLDGELVGIVNLFRHTRSKTRHKAILGGMYVAPEARGHGVGKVLLTTVIDQARSLAGLEDLTLAVTVGNPAARALYIGAGFVPYGVEPRYIRVDQHYYDIEWMILHLG